MLRALTLLSVLVLLLAGCASDKSGSADSSREASWVTSTSPRNEETNVSAASNISIRFNTDLDPASVNADMIAVIEGKHSGNITALYDWAYDKANRTLLLTFKSDYGSGNSVDVTLSGHLKNTDGKEMGKEYRFGFQTR
jgi:ABC-type glycerol-3-phosphate transport system substrate-binding protein